MYTHYNATGFVPTHPTPPTFVTSSPSSQPVIDNTNEYMYERKMVSISSEDRDLVRFPSANSFELMLPQDLCNVSSVQLNTWSFPANYTVFSNNKPTNNTTLAFSFNASYIATPQDYTPGSTAAYNFAIMQAILHKSLRSYPSNMYVAILQNGTYTPAQLQTALANAMNLAVNEYIQQYYNNYTAIPASLETLGIPSSLDIVYDRFILQYNEVSMKMWIANTADKFIINVADSTNTSNLGSGPADWFESTFNEAAAAATLGIGSAASASTMPNFSNYGMPYNLGLERQPDKQSSISIYTDANYSMAASKGLITSPVFDYMGTSASGGNIWVSPVPNVYYQNQQSTSNDDKYIAGQVWYIEPPQQLNIMGPLYFYMCIPELNTCDQTSPFTLSKHTVQTNEGNGMVNAYFTKIAITSGPLSQFYDNGTSSDSYKYYSPALPRIRKLTIQFRYHDGSLVNFTNIPFSFTLQFNLLRHQSKRLYSSITDSQSCAVLQQK